MASIASLAPPAHARHLYVAPTGDDLASGSLAAPWKTVSASLPKLVPGDTLDLRSGTYHEQPIAGVSGTAAQPIVVRSFPGEAAIIDPCYPEFETPGSGAWLLVDAARGEYKSVGTYPSGHLYGYVAGIPGYENEQVLLVPYVAPACFRSASDVYDSTGFYVGPGSYRDPDGHIYIRLAKTTDMRAAEARYGAVFATENANPNSYSIMLSHAAYALRVNGAYWRFEGLTLRQGENTISLGDGAHDLRFDRMTVWSGDDGIETGGAGIHHVTLNQCKFYGDRPYWIFWTDMKDVPAPANYARGTTIDLRSGAHDWEIAYCHIRGGGQDLIGTADNEYNISIHHNRLENAGDDALELEGTVDVGRIDVYENFILNCLDAVAPGQDTPHFTGPLFIYRNTIALLRDPPINRVAGMNSWNGGGRFGFEYTFKQAGSGFSTANTHIYQNTVVMLNSAGKGIGITPQNPADTRCANNVFVMINGPVNGAYHQGPGQVVDGNVYWKANTATAGALLGDHDTVAEFTAATGLEAHGQGATPKRGTDPELVCWRPSVVDRSAPVWAMTPAGERVMPTDFVLSDASPARGAGISIPAVPGFGALPDSRNSVDVGAIPFGASMCDYSVFPFDPTHGLGPSVDAGRDRAIGPPYQLILGGSACTGGSPTPALAINWSVLVGPGPVTFSNVHSASPIVTFGSPGIYLLILSASDGRTTARDTVRIIATSASPTVAEAKVAAGADDGEESASGVVSLTSSDLELMLDGGIQETVAMRFLGLSVPAGAIVTKAYIQFTADEAQADSTVLAIQGEAADNAPPLTSLAGGLSMLPGTAASASWTPAPWATVGEAAPLERTPDLSAVVQEIVSRPGWSTGNALVLFVSGIGHRTARSYEGTAAEAAMLHVEYQTGTPVLAAAGEAVLAFAARIAPNPFHRAGALQLDLGRAGPVRVELFDLHGARVAKPLDSARLAPGRHSVRLPERLPPGMYFYKVRAPEGALTGRFLVLD